MGKIVSLDQAPELIILDHLNTDNSINLQSKDITMGAPLGLDGDARANTQITISAAEGNEVYFGDKTVKYNRLDLDTLFAGQLAVVTGPIHDNVTAVDLLNPEFSLQIASGATYASEVDPVGVVTVMIQDHLVYQPNTAVKVIDEFDYNLAIFKELVHTNLADASEPAA